MPQLLTLVSVILWPFSPRCHSHTEIILSGESSIAASNAPLSARLKHKLFTEPVKSPFPMMATVANDTEFQTRMCGCKDQQKKRVVNNCYMFAPSIQYFLTKASLRSRPAHWPVATRSLFGCMDKLRWTKFNVSIVINTANCGEITFWFLPFNVVRVSNVMSLGLLVDIVEHNDGRHKVCHLTGRQLIQIRSAIFAPIPVHPIQFQFLTRRRLHFPNVERVSHIGRRMQYDRSTAQK